MFDKLDDVEARYERLTQELSSPDVMQDTGRYQAAAKQHSELTPLVESYREWKSLQRQLAESREMQKDPDPEVREMAGEEQRELEARVPGLQRELMLMLLPKDPHDSRDVMVEIRAGTGGEEAALFAGELLRMYTRYAERMGWKAELLSTTETGIGGYKEAILAIKGEGAYSHLKWEGGPHRVQRVPVTESGGRIHTSAATVAVMPEVDEVEVNIHPDELEWQFTLSQGAGGQNVQKNQTAVRLTHKPTGLVVGCQDERSQLQNKEKALRMLRARLYDIKMAEQNAEIYAARKSQVASGDRSDKIRTYNFQQNRVTDHRNGKTLINQLDQILDGDILDMVESLRTWDEANRLAEQSRPPDGAFERDRAEPKPMTCFEIPIPASADLDGAEAIVEAAAAAVGLAVTMRAPAASYPGSTHWHFKREEESGKRKEGRLQAGVRQERGVLEATLWPKRRRLWLSVQSGRAAPWVEQLAPELAERLRRCLAGPQPPEG